MIDLTTMLAAMKEEPWATWRIVADAMEEAGDKRAAGLRMLAKYKMYPEREPGFGRSENGWYWERSDRGARKFKGPKLPNKVFKDERITSFDMIEGYLPHLFETAADAVIEAAGVWSDYLAKRPLKDSRERVEKEGAR